MATYVRNNAMNLGGDFSNPDLLWYAKGVGVMMGRALDDPHSWWFFAAIHGEYVNPKNPWYNAGLHWADITSPPTVPTTPLPSASIQAVYWNQCQHGTWYFVPWHRGYLMALEAQLRADIVSLGGPADWSLPYWNYFDPKGGGQYNLPPAFAATTLPDGSQNPLYVAMRFGPSGDGNVYVPTPAWEAAHSGSPPPVDGEVTDTVMKNDLFTGSDAATPKPGFGGPKTPFSHSGGGFGNLESNPHNLVHVYVGGSNAAGAAGLMSDPGTAGLDPIFYLHHCNIDRMWASWNAWGNSNPTTAAWLNGPPARQFIMPWPGSTTGWSYTPMQVGNLNALNYAYAQLDTKPGAGSSTMGLRLTALGATGAADAVSAGRGRMTLSHRSQLIGASATAVPVGTAGLAAIPVKLDSAGRKKVIKSLEKPSEGALPDRTYLEVENLTGNAEGVVLNVFVGLKTGATRAQRRGALVGQVGLFGVRRASVADGEHAGQGLSFALDITRVVDPMVRAGGFDVDSIDVSLIPTRPMAPGIQFRVGRISVHREAL